MGQHLVQPLFSLRMFRKLYQIKMLVNNILVPRDRLPFGQHQDSGHLGGSSFQSMRRVILSYSQPIRFVTLDPEHAQSDGKLCWTFLEVVILGAKQKETRPLGTRMSEQLNKTGTNVFLTSVT